MITITDIKQHPDLKQLLKEGRYLEHMTVYELSQTLNVGTYIIKAYEQGTQQPDDSYLRQFCELLNDSEVDLPTEFLKVSYKGSQAGKKGPQRKSLTDYLRGASRRLKEDRGLDMDIICAKHRKGKGWVPTRARCLKHNHDFYLINFLPRERDCKFCRKNRSYLTANLPSTAWRVELPPIEK